MAAKFNDEAVNSVFDRILGYALVSGRFDAVNQHEPKSAPGNGVSSSVWVQRIRPIRSSGLNSTSGVLVLTQRIYTSFKKQPFDMIDPEVTAATTDIMGALSGAFELGGLPDVRAIDLLGTYGVALEAQAGYVEIDRTFYRVMTITIPVIINDMFVQVP